MNQYSIQQYFERINKAKGMIWYWEGKNNHAAAQAWRNQVDHLSSQLEYWSDRLEFFADLKRGKVREMCMEMVNEIRDFIGEGIKSQES